MLPSETYIPITIYFSATPTIYNQLTNKVHQYKFVRELSYNIGSGDIYNHVFNLEAKSFSANIPLSAAKRLSEVYEIHSDCSKEDYQCVKDMREFISEFNIYTITCAGQAISLEECRANELFIPAEDLL